MAIICGIYKITNQLNKKFYIGKSVNIYKRWTEHCRSTDTCPIHKAIQKYGKENFSLTILEECTKQELNDKEIFWIQKYNGYQDSNCYNATRGGDGASHPVKISHDNLLEIINLLKTTDKTLKEIADLYNVSSSTISAINNGRSRILESEQYPIRRQYINKNTFKKEQYHPQYTTTGQEIQKYHSIQVGQYNDKWELINIYPSVRQAARVMHCNPESIRKALKSKTHKSYNFLWKQI